ncbi:PTS sugar transporter subunit IIB [Enterococcus sp. LJL90]
MLIFICCAGGMTSSMFCQKISKAADAKVVHFGHLHEVIKNFEQLSAAFPTLIAYGGEGEITKYNLESVFKPYVDQVLVCPQVRYKTPSLKKLLETIDVPCADIDMKTFGNMNGEKALADIFNLQKKLQIK